MKGDRTQDEELAEEWRSHRPKSQFGRTQTQVSRLQGKNGGEGRMTMPICKVCGTRCIVGGKGQTHYYECPKCDEMRDVDGSAGREEGEK